MPARVKPVATDVPAALLATRDARSHNGDMVTPRERRSASISTGLVAVGSVVAFTALVVALWWREHHDRAEPLERPLIVYAAPASRLPLEEIRIAYEHETGRFVDIRYEPSEVLLEKVRLSHPTEPADVFIPADDSYVRRANEGGLITESVPVARMRAVLLTAKGNPKNLAAWPDLLRGGVRVVVPNPSAAVGKLARDHLVRTGKWPDLAPHVVGALSVTDAANAVRAGGVDAAIVWDAVANGPNYAGQTVLALPELAGVTGRVEAAVLKQSRGAAAARRFACFVAASDRGLIHFRAARFVIEDNGGTWAELLSREPGGAK
jgi:molybdate transport system substrate-binding protein